MPPLLAFCLRLRLQVKNISLFRKGRNWLRCAGSYCRSARPVVITPAIALGTNFREFFGYKKHPNDFEIREKIHEALQVEREGRMVEAESMLLSIIQRAKQVNHNTGLNYALDCLGNIYYKISDNKRAEQMYIELIQALLSQGLPRNSPGVIDASLKLADIYASVGDDKKAEEGYVFCLEAQKDIIEKLLKQNKSGSFKQKLETIEIDSHVAEKLSLYGMAAYAYARFLVSKGRYEDSEFYFNEAVQISSRVFFVSHPQTLNLFLNYGRLLLAEQQYAMAEYYLRQILSRVAFCDGFAPNLPVFYQSYAETLFHLGEYQQSLSYAQRAAEIAQELNQSDVIQGSKQFLQSLESDVRKLTSKKGWFW